MNDDTCNMLTAMKQSEKPSGCYKIRGKAFKTNQKVRLVCKVHGALVAVRLLVVFVHHVRKGLWDPENGSKEDPICQTPSIQWEITSRKIFQLGKETSSTAERKEGEGWKGHVHLTAMLKCVRETPVMIVITQTQKTQPVCQLGLKQADKGNTCPCYAQWSLRPGCYRQLQSPQVCLRSKETRKRGCLVKIKQVVELEWPQKLA